MPSRSWATRSGSICYSPGVTAPRHTNPVPKLLIYGLVGGILLFTIILIVIFLGREKTSPLEDDHSSESRSASPPQ